MRLNLASTVALALALTTAHGTTIAQVGTPVSEAKAMQSLSLNQRDAVLDAIKAAFRKSYVFPEKTPAIIARLDRAKAAGRYNVANPNELAGPITSDLRDASQDGHAFLQYDPQRFAAATSSPAASAVQDLVEFNASAARRDHHGLTELRILAGNIRYLKITGFAWVSDETG